jgi:RNA polymerase sigma factor (TIGR02999 family)
MPNPPARRVTLLLQQWRAGDERALDQLMPLVYDELRRLASRSLRSERPGHTLQPTALVNEVYLRLVNVEIPWQDRAHFFAIAANMMRRILVDHARAKRRAKRGGGFLVTFNEALVASKAPTFDILALDDALLGLSRLDDRKGRIVELHFFGGLSYDETAEAVGVSPATVDRELRLAKAWLHHEMSRKGA